MRCIVVTSVLYVCHVEDPEHDGAIGGEDPVRKHILERYGCSLDRNAIRLLS
jgi:hypothetical protein